MYKTSIFVASTVVSVLACLSVRADDCKVYEESSCPQISALKCGEMSSCVPADIFTVNCTAKEIQEVPNAKRTDIRDPVGCEEGHNDWENNGSNYCYQERDCERECVFDQASGIWYCEEKGGQWQDAGNNWLLLVGAGPACDNCGGGGY